MELFGSLLGNEKLKATAASDIYAKKPSHAYIIEGPAGSGRHHAARLIASALLCERRSHERFPCGECLPCRKIEEGICTDVIYVNRGTKATIGVDVIRDVKRSLSLAPVESAYKVYIIEEADKMTVQAQNSLLLSLEEPPSFVVFILLCTDSKLLLETVRSRAPVIKTELFTTDAIAKYLSGMDDLKEFDQSAIRQASSAAGGSIGKAVALLKDRDAPEFKAAALCREIMPTLLSGSLEERLSLLKKFPSKRDEAVSFLKTVDAALRDVIVSKKSKNAELLFFTDASEASRLAASTTAKRLVTLYDEASEASAKIAANVNVQPVIMLFLTKN